jgi:hypothetical protein
LKAVERTQDALAIQRIRIAQTLFHSATRLCVCLPRARKARNYMGLCAMKKTARGIIVVCAPMRCDVLIGIDARKRLSRFVRAYTLR